MAYQVVVTDTANKEIDAIVGWYREQSLAAADRWHEGLMEKIATLRDIPERCRINRDYSLPGLTVRQLLFGGKHGQYRILFEIHRKTVYVLRVRHAARNNNA